MTKVQNLRRDAFLQPSTVNVEDRSVELIWSTGARVLRVDTEVGLFWEELSLEDGHVRLGRLNRGANLLNSHRNRDVRDIVGVVTKAWIGPGAIGRAGYARVKFSSRPDAIEIFNDVRDGIVRSISVGYSTYQIEKRATRSSIPVFRAIDWEPHELSLVAVPADEGAMVRYAGNLEVPRLRPASAHCKHTYQRQGCDGMAIFEQCIVCGSRRAMHVSNPRTPMLYGMTWAQQRWLAGGRLPDNAS